MEEKKPKATHSGTFKLGSLSVTVHVLDNGQRIIDAESMENFMKWMEGGGEGATEVEVTEFCKAIKGS